VFVFTGEEVGERTRLLDAPGGEFSGGNAPGREDPKGGSKGCCELVAVGRERECRRKVVSSIEEEKDEEDEEEAEAEDAEGRKGKEESGTFPPWIDVDPSVEVGSFKEGKHRS